MQRFYEAGTPDARRIALLDRLGVDFVWVGEEERELGGFDPGAVDYLEPVTTGPAVSVYRVRLPAR